MIINRVNFFMRTKISFYESEQNLWNSYIHYKYFIFFKQFNYFHQLSCSISLISILLKFFINFLFLTIQRRNCSYTIIGDRTHIRTAVSRTLVFRPAWYLCGSKVHRVLWCFLLSYNPNFFQLMISSFIFILHQLIISSFIFLF